MSFGDGAFQHECTARAHGADRQLEPGGGTVASTTTSKRRGFQLFSSIVRTPVRFAPVSPQDLGAKIAEFTIAEDQDLVPRANLNLLKYLKSPARGSVKTACSSLTESGTR